jgi:hypothetical protein
MDGDLATGISPEVGVHIGTSVDANSNGLHSDDSFRYGASAEYQRMVCVPSQRIRWAWASLWFHCRQLLTSR